MTTSLHPVAPSPGEAVPPSEVVPPPADDLGPRPGRAPALPADERRASIIAAATPLLRASGHSVTTREIADAAGIAEGTLFRVFDTKGDLIDAVVEQALDLGDTITSIHAIDRALPLADRVRACAVVLSNRLASVLDLMIALRRHPGAPGGPGADANRPDLRHPRGHQNPAHNMVLTAVAEVLQPDAKHLTYRPDRAAHLLWLMVFAGTHRMINAGDPLTPDEIADVFLHGITRPES